MIFLLPSYSVNWPRFFMSRVPAVNFGGIRNFSAMGQQMFNSSQMFLSLFANVSSFPNAYDHNIAVSCMLFYPLPFKLRFLSLIKRISCVPSADFDEFAVLKLLAGVLSAGRLIIPRMAKRSVPAFVHVDDIDSDGEDAPLRSIADKLVVSRSRKSQDVVNTFSEKVLCSVAVSADLGPGTLEALEALGQRPKFVRMVPCLETQSRSSSTPKQKPVPKPRTSLITSPVEDPAESMEVGGDALATTVLEAGPVNPPGEPVLASADPEAEQGAPPQGPSKKRRCNPGKKTREKLKRIRDARPEGTQPASSVSAPQQQQAQQYQHRQQPYVRRGGMGDPPLAAIIAKHRDLRPGGACPVDLRTKVQILK